EIVQQELELDEPAHSMLGSMNVGKVPGASANLISLNYRGPKPEETQTICNVWAKAYQDDARDRTITSTVSGIDYLEKQIAGVQNDLRDLEQQMADLEQEYLGSGINIASDQGSVRISDLMAQIATSRVEIEAVQAQIDRTRSRLAEEPREIEEVQQEPSYRAAAIEQQLSQLHVELQKKLQSYYEDSPEVRALRSQVAELEGQLEQRSEMTRASVTTQANPVYQKAQDSLIDLYGRLDALRATHAALEKQLGEQRALAEMTPAGSIEYNELMRKAEGLQTVHATLLSQLYDLELKRATAVSPVQLVREADLPRTPVSPQYQAILGIGFALALLLAALAAVVMDQVDDTFADPDEIRDLLDTRLVGVLPDIDKASQVELQVGGEHGAARTAFANAMRMLASTVRIEMARSHITSMTVTSAGRSEGKSLIAANLAAALAHAGETVLLVDADLHRPRLHTLFDVTRESGLSNLLIGDVTPEQVIQETEIKNLRVLTSGPLPPSPVDLLASAHGQEVITQLAGMASYVIWDTPPAGFIADATVVAHKTDCTLFVVGKQARRMAVRQTVQNLREIGTQIIGVCANQVRPMGGSYYYYYYYNYYSKKE
ncbi:MAG: polysaccharide biosynthesis tyrosine autokinase, partial [Chloroflexi bacterium]|nr:polysaccharide biosynthesis tyrosine autokinase [Chloroflexota bacterium]